MKVGWTSGIETYNSFRISFMPVAFNSAFVCFILSFGATLKSIPSVLMRAASVT